MQKFKHELNKNFRNDKIQQHFKTLKEHLHRQRCYLNSILCIAKVKRKNGKFDIIC